MHIWVAKIQQFLQTNSPKSNRDWAKNFAKAIDHPQSSLGNQSSDRFDDSEEDVEDVFETHKMRLSMAVCL